MSSDASGSIYFSGVPKVVTEGALRPIFERVGALLSFRMVKDRAETNFGYVEYADNATAQRAVSLLNETKVGGVPMKVAVGIERKRGRDTDGRFGGRGGRGGRRGEEQQQPALLPDGRVPFRFPPVDPMLAALNRIAVADGYEAVEQLRLLSLHNPEGAVELLNRYPQLAVATVLVLQQAKKLPEELPPEAAHEPAPAEVAKGSAASAAAQEGGVGGANGSSFTFEEIGLGELDGDATAGPSEEEVMAIVQDIPPEEVESTITLTKEQLLAIADLNVRRQLALLQRKLKEMSAGLEAE